MGNRRVRQASRIVIALVGLFASFASPGARGSCDVRPPTDRHARPAFTLLRAAVKPEEMAVWRHPGRLREG
jgi:hypothetical protein